MRGNFKIIFSLLLCCWDWGEGGVRVCFYYFFFHKWGGGWFLVGDFSFFSKGGSPNRESTERSNESFVSFLGKAVMRFKERCFNVKIALKYIWFFRGFATWSQLLWQPLLHAQIPYSKFQIKRKLVWNPGFSPRRLMSF